MASLFLGQEGANGIVIEERNRSFGFGWEAIFVEVLVAF